MLKVYINGEWKSIMPEGSMNSSIYDTQGKNTDIFKYIDDAVAAVADGSFGNVDEHISNQTIHVTPEEKASWSDSATVEDINSAAESLESTIDTKIADIINEEVSGIEELTESANTLKNTIDNHSKNTAIHPSIEKQSEWDAKASGDHTHHLDGNVTISSENISGAFSSDALPYDVKERVYLISSEEELYAITKNPVHNGDTFCIETESGNIWYFVINDEYLGITDIDPETSLPVSAKAFKKFDASSIAWKNVIDTPTTLEGYGITDGVTKAEFAEIENEVAEISSAIPSDTDISNTVETNAMYNNVVSDLSELDEAIVAMDALINKVADIAK